MISALYAGVVTHERFRPRRHKLRYRIFQGLFDLDEIDGVAGRLCFFSRNRFNLFSFHDRDYGDRSGEPLRAQIEALLEQGGVPFDGGPIRLLTMPRVMGHVFNPISIWFCHRRDGGLAALIYEVTNTFKDRHCYLIPVEGEAGRVIRQQCAKSMYVSPFMDLDMTYDFAICPPGETVRVAINGGDTGGPLITALFTGERRPLSDGHLLRVFLAFPLLTLKVVAGIHLEALVLWAKGLGIRRRPAPPEAGMTLGR